LEAPLEVISRQHLHHILQVSLDLFSVLKTEHCLTEWFTMGTAHDKQQRTTVLQAVFAQHSNFRDFGVAPHTS